MDQRSVHWLPDVVRCADLVVRRWRAEDAAALGRAVAESIDHLRPWMPWVAHEPLTGEQRRALIAEWDQGWDAGGDAVYGVFLDGAVVGGCGLHVRSGPGVRDIGYWIHVDHVGRGFATAVARGLTDAAFTLQQITAVDIHHDQANRASAGVPRRLGFRRISEQPDAVSAPAEAGVDCTWRMTRECWTVEQAGDRAARCRP